MEEIIKALIWSDEVANNMSDEEWKHLHDGDDEEIEVFG